MRTVTCVLMCLFLFACAHAIDVQTENERRNAPFSTMIAFYRGPLNHLEAVRSGECPMYPSCSEYSLQAVRKHGWLQGWIMGMGNYFCMKVLGISEG